MANLVEAKLREELQKGKLRGPNHKKSMPIGPFRTSTVTSNFMIGATAAAGSVAFLRLGVVDPSIAGPVAVGIVPGAMLGSWMVSRVRVRALRVVLASGEILNLKRGDKIPFETPAIQPPGSTKNTAGYFLRPGMDYLDQIDIRRHIGWTDFEIWRKSSGARLILATTRGATPYPAFAFRPDDILLMGREVLPRIRRVAAELGL